MFQFEKIFENIEYKAAQNAAELDEIQARLEMRHVKFFIAPNIKSSPEQCVAGALEMFREIEAGNTATMTEEEWRELDA